jgi:uncharacterized damage-inducible protein DinB
MTTRLFVTALALLFATPLTLTAQNAVVSSLKGLFDITKQNIMATAEMLDDELYAFHPTEEVRSVGRILAHVANSQHFFCSSAAGEDNPNTENLEETRTTKADIIAALEESFAYCESVYAKTTDAKGAEPVTFFGGPNTVSGVLAFNSAHNYEHYGNLVTYMRLNGITPPSSM